MSRQSTPSPPPQDLWSSILDSVSSKRSIPSKSILILGEQGSGRSTIASALLQKQHGNTEEHVHDFALGYQWTDVRDDAEEDTLARLSVFTVPSSSPPYLSLIPRFLPPKSSLPNTVAIVVLDWTRPWTFLEQLLVWLQWLERWASGDNSRELDILKEETRERLQSYLQHYNATSLDQTSPLPHTSVNTLLPLESDVFTHNSSGIPIIIACTKADLIDDDSDLVGGGNNIMVKGKSEQWEERTDGVMQVLRTICMKYGAALFYTTQQPTTLSELRHYALHLLFMQPTSATSEGALGRNPFPQSHKPNTLDRDRIFVPAGWDSWGKIQILRDNFEYKVWSEAWEREIDPEKQNESPGPGAKQLFETLIGGNQGPRKASLTPLVLPVPEQNFLSKNWDENSKKPDRDPRTSFRNLQDNMGTATHAGIVGPLGSSSFSLPTVERALSEMEGGSSLSADARRVPNARRVRVSDVPSRPLLSPSPMTGSSRPPASPGLSSPLGSATGQTQHEVLQTFFQSLLTSNNRSGARQSAQSPTNVSATTASPEPQPTSPGVNGTNLEHEERLEN
ncbi:hypothetical protein SISSUDRAFT_979151 [Sistotremastrum suecicum HHB10207 ss-3]|uniref:DLIC-domain-containing protein n=1 Tax=Sistotremastrum suecicum HHB10207 ss-3 TaxID=1314776 RepID=A0A166HQP7_9AGAM|nr:hypothetical protein SISSUDRAFT_979151 [Sistotremastrum suecicum HHB10207 ss-3]